MIEIKKHFFIKKNYSFNNIKDSDLVSMNGNFIIYKDEFMGWCIEYLECEICKLKIQNHSFKKLISCDEEIIKNIIE